LEQWDLSGLSGLLFPAHAQLERPRRRGSPFAVGLGRHLFQVSSSGIYSPTAAHTAQSGLGWKESVKIAKLLGKLVLLISQRRFVRDWGGQRKRPMSILPSAMLLRKNQ